MNKSNIVKATKVFHQEITKKSPEIAITVGLLCFGGAVISAWKAAPKVELAIDMKKKELECDRLPAKEVFKAVWKYFIPMGLSFSAGAMCILGAHKIQGTRNAALAAAYQLTETAFREYKNKVVETIGEKSEKQVRQEIAKGRIKENPPVSSQIIVTGRGKTRCYDGISGRYFESDIETIRQIVNRLNFRLRQEHYISLNEFYWELGLPHVDLGDMLGWNIDEVGECGFDITFTSILPEDGIPTLALTYLICPRNEYKSY